MAKATVFRTRTEAAKISTTQQLMGGGMKQPGETAITQHGFQHSGAGNEVSPAITQPSQGVHQQASLDFAPGTGNQHRIALILPVGYPFRPGLLPGGDVAGLFRLQKRTGRGEIQAGTGNDHGWLVR